MRAADVGSSGHLPVGGYNGDQTNEFNDLF
jgi:hypothetical protein